MSEPLSDEELATFGDGADVTGSAPQWQVAKLVTEIIRLRAENEGLRSEHDELQESIKDLGVDRDLAPYRD